MLTIQCAVKPFIEFIEYACIPLNVNYKIIYQQYYILVQEELCYRILSFDLDR